VPWLRWVILVVGAVAAVAMLLPRLTGRLAAVTAIAAVLAGLAGPTSYAIDTIATPHSGSIVAAGPNTGGMGFGGRGGPGGAGDGRGFGPRDGMPPMPGGMGQAPAPGGMAQAPGGMAQAPGGMPKTAGMPQMSGGAESRAMGGGAGGLLNESTPSAELTALLTSDADGYTWVAAAVGSNSASGYQLATERSVMPIGGFNGSDPSPTLARFQQYVADGEIHYFIAGGGMGGRMGGSGTASEISQWVTENFTPITVDGVTLYDLTAPTDQAGT
jgi:hypothetical protein